ncbi:small multi-drug export protein [Methanolacinia paynteri]|uniref:small multi-drug export protein n=1 Tax=Methanolacinia paynteri TaxID=230356 RepID=UPI00064EB720|nr:small multi-drug export protein [Methanolacinia paynteri]
MEAEYTNSEIRILNAGKIILNLSLPFAILGVYIFVLWMLLPYSLFLSMLTLMFIYFVPPAGKESVIPIGIALGIPWWTVAFSIAMMDILSTLFMVLNFDLVLKIPIAGTKWMKTFMEHGESFFRKHRWLEKLSTLGLAIFVMIPMQGTGGIATPIVGRMIGIPPLQIILAVIAGALSGCFLIALGSEFLKDLLVYNLSLGIIVIIAIAVCAAAAWFLWKRKQNRLKERKPAHRI